MAARGNPTATSNNNNAATRRSFMDDPFCRHFKGIVNQSDGVRRGSWREKRGVDRRGRCGCGDDIGTAGRSLAPAVAGFWRVAPAAPTVAV